MRQISSGSTEELLKLPSATEQPHCVQARGINCSISKERGCESQCTVPMLTLYLLIQPYSNKEWGSSGMLAFEFMPKPLFIYFQDLSYLQNVDDHVWNHLFLISTDVFETNKQKKKHIGRKYLRFFS